MGAVSRGFTLMESLVMLLLVSFATLLMFQMLGNYRVAKERIVAQSAGIDRRALFGGWFRDSIRSLQASARTEFRGDAHSLSGVSLNPAVATPGAGVAIAWSLARSGDAWEIRYSEDGRELWRLPLAQARDASFAYLDAQGDSHDTWPPALGLATPLPAAVVLRRKAYPGAMPPAPVVASVHGSLKPVLRVFELEQD